MRRLHNLTLDQVMIQDTKLEATNKVFDVTIIICGTLRRISSLIDRLAADNMDSILYGKLTTTLVEPNELRSILNGISKRIPNRYCKRIR